MNSGRRAVFLDHASLDLGDLDMAPLRQVFDDLHLHAQTPPELIIKRLQGAQVAISNKVPLDASTACGLPGFQTALVQRLNAARAVARSCGNTVMPAAGPLVWNQRLFSAADRHARDMATRNYFSHTSLDGRSLAQRVAAEGYAWTSVGENLAGGQATVDGVIAGWLSSPGHCSNLMSRQFEAVGVSCVRQAGSRFGHYWVMVLARP